MSLALHPDPDWQGFRARGWNAFALPPRTKRPASSWKQYQTERPSLDDQRRWQAEGCNAAIVTGIVSRLLVLDCDTPEAIAEAERLGTNGAPSVKTAKGVHFYFAHPGGQVGNKARFIPGMDLRGDGGFVVAPGSIHPSGARYEWQKPPEGDLPPAPGWLLDAVTLKPPEAAPAAPRIKPAIHASPYGQAALQSEIEAMRAAPEGTRNHQLNKSAFALAQLAASGDVAENEATAELRLAALETGLEQDEVETTLASGWRAGQANPRADRIVAAPAAARAAQTPSPPLIIRGDELAAMHFSPLQWAIPGILPEGMTLLAGKPKAGKSFLSIQMVAAVATGDCSMFGAPDMEPGDVLYLALEDSPRRLQKRARDIRMGPISARTHFATTWPRFDQVGIEMLAQWHDAHPSARLIIIDTLRAIKAPAKGRQSAYDEDASSVAPLHEFTKSRPGLAVLVIHHTRKQESSDVFDLISGTRGLSGVFDTLMVLSHDALGNATLSAQGRDLESYSKALERDLRTGGWRFVGEALPRAKTGERQELLDLLTQAGVPVALGQLAESVRKKSDTTHRLLAGLAAEGLVCQPRHGMYALTHSTHSISEEIDVSIF